MAHAGVRVLLLSQALDLRQVPSEVIENRSKSKPKSFVHSFLNRLCLFCLLGI
jgi:hypothetical protein